MREHIDYLQVLIRTPFSKEYRRLLTIDARLRRLERKWEVRHGH